MALNNETRAVMAKILKKQWMEMPDESFKPLTFGELKEGDKFIVLPEPGDNSGHGGLLEPFYIFVKTKILNSKFSNLQENALRLTDGTLSRMTDEMLVIEITA